MDGNDVREGLGEAQKVSEEIPLIDAQAQQATIDRLNDEFFDPDSNKDGKVKTVEFQGKMKDEPSKNVHDILTVTARIKIVTHASSDHAGLYEMWVMKGEEEDEDFKSEKIYINSTDPELAKKIHEAYFQKLQETSSVEEATFWLTSKSEFATMKSPEDPKAPLVDFLERDLRQRIMKHVGSQIKNIQIG